VKKNLSEEEQEENTSEEKFYIVSHSFMQFLSHCCMAFFVVLREDGAVNS
jgi:hypothetical protein